MYLHDYGDEAASFSKEEIQQGFVHSANFVIKNGCNSSRCLFQCFVHWFIDTVSAQ